MRRETADALRRLANRIDTRPSRRVFVPVPDTILDVQVQTPEAPEIVAALRDYARRGGRLGMC